MKRHTHLTIAILLVILAAAASLRADDTEIYGVVSTPSIPPNVLIIFDTSGSMATEDVPGDPYEPATTYSGSYTTNAVYQRVWNGHSYQWNLFTDSIDNIACPAIKTDLLSDGYAVGKIRATNFTCGGTTQRRLRLGNFMNYDASGIGLPQSRISVAQQVLTDLITRTNDVRFGMMVYNSNDSDATSGGRLLAPCSVDKAPLLTAVANASPSGWTPLAETLAEAGLYFAGKPSWFNTSGFPAGTYTISFAHAGALPEELHHPDDRRRTHQGPAPQALRYGLYQRRPHRRPGRRPCQPLQWIQHPGILVPRREWQLSKLRRRRLGLPR